MTDAQVSRVAGLRDARPDSLCTQTFFRNHDVIWRCLRYASRRQTALRVWDIGGGVLEPLLIAAMCEFMCATDRLTGYSVVSLDASPEVAAILQAAQQHERWSQGDLLVVDDHGSIQLSGMAEIFSATHSEVNTWLTDSVAMSAQIQQWLDLGMGPYFGIPSSVCHSQQDMAEFLARGLAPQETLYKHLRHISGDVVAANRLLEHGSSYDVVLSNFSLQYPIWEGRGHQALKQIERHLAPGGLLQIANAYSAQQALIAILAGSPTFLRSYCVELSLREAFVVSRYASDAQSAPPRLVPRVDILCTPEDQPISGIEVGEAQAFAEHLGGRTLSVASLLALSDLMQEYTGLEAGSMMVYHGWWNPHAKLGYACLLPRDVALAFGRNPLRNGQPMQT